MMKLYFLLTLAASTIGQLLAQPVPVPVTLLNPNFEDDKCPPGVQCSWTGITGWTIGPQIGMGKFSTAQFPNGLPGGGWYAANVGNAYATGSIFQTTPRVVRANETYTLILSIGARANYAFTGYIAELMAGNVAVASDNTLSPAPGTFLTDSIVYKSGPNPPQLGLPLQILVRSFGTGQVDVTGVSLTVQ